MALRVEWSDEELPSVLALLNRALNTWEPAGQPEWAMSLADRVERRIAGLAKAAAERSDVPNPALQGQ